VKLRVPASAIAELPLERKLSLLDQENDLLAAVDLRDTQEERWLQSREAEYDAWSRKREAEDAREKAQKARTPLEVPEAAIREAVLRIEFARADLELQRALFRAADLALLAAEAKYEQARAAEVLEAGLTGARGLREAEFKAQTEKLSALAQQRTEEAAGKRAAADKAQAALQQARAELTRLTGGAQGSAWVQ
jgi:thioesterase domain-containing protein